MADGSRARPRARARPHALNVATSFKNNEILNWSRTVIAIVAGLLAGACGLTGFSGFALYAVAHVVSSLAFLARLGFAPDIFFPHSGFLDFIGNGLQQSCLLFVVLWAVGYGALWVF